MDRLRLKDIADIKNLRNAVRFVKEDKAEERIHCPLYDLPYLWKIEKKLLDLGTRLLNGTYQPQKCTILEVVKSSFTTRPISHINIEDWIVAQGILNKVAPILDKKIPPNSFAYRLNPKRDSSSKHKFFKAWYRDWPKFIKSIRDSVSGELPCLLITDIAGYFENIDLDRLKQMSIDAGVSQEVADLLGIQLESWTWRYLYVIHRQRGLLQGNAASYLYANFYLWDIDEYYEKKGIVYHRFLDDVNIHAKSKSEAKIILTKLNQFLRNKGLALNTAKTYILEGNEIENHFMFSLMDEIEVLLKDIKKNGDSSQLKRKRKDIYKKILKWDRLNSYLFKRLLTAYIQTRDGTLFKNSIKYLELYPDLTDKLCQYYRSLKNGNKVAEFLLEFLTDDNRNLFPSQEQRIIECLLDIDINSQSIWKRIAELSKAKVHNKECNYYSKALYSLLLYKYGERQELQEVTGIYLHGRETEPVLRKYLALGATRLAGSQELDDVIERLKLEANPELTELGVFLDEAKKVNPINNLLKHINLRTFYFGKDKVFTLDIRSIILLNILKYNREGANTQLLENHINRYKSKIASKRVLRLLEEIIARL